MAAAADRWNDEWFLKMGAMSPSFWAGVIDLQLRRMENGAQAVREHRDHPERSGPFDGFGASFTQQFGPIDADAYFLLVAVRHVMGLCPLFADRYDRTRVDEAEKHFLSEAPDAKDARDVIAHLDAYSVGKGRRPDFEADGQWFIQVGIDDSRDEFDLRLGKLHVELKRTARAALALARTLNEISAPIAR